MLRVREVKRWVHQSKRDKDMLLMVIETKRYGYVTVRKRER